MVLLKKVYLLWVYVGVLLAGFLLCIVFFRANIDERWIDPTTWSAESRVLLPAETKMLKVSNQVGEVQSNGMQNFKFETEYCYLYEIESTDETATLKCSLLPYYYAIRQKEVPKDWKEKADISIVIKSTDVQPSEFLGRIDKSFKSIRALGSSTYAISLQLQGVRIYPKPTIQNKISHWLMSLRNQKQNLAIRIDEYKVSKLDDATAEEKLAYASNWSDLVRKQMNADIVVPAEKKSTIQESVNLLSDYFKFAEVGCKSLTSCEFGYEGNPAENVMYLLYFLSSSDKDSYKRIEKKVKEGLYPFNGVIPKLENSNQSETERADWGFMAVYKFPICPVSDIIQGKSSARTQLFGEYVKTSADNSVTRDQLIQRLKSVNFKTGTQPTEWDSEFVISVDLACHRLLTSPKDAELLSLVTSTYLNMFNSQFGQLKSLEKKDIVDLIYTNQAYTGYRSLWLINPIIMQEREGQLETTETQANQYTEWKSILKSLIALNLYETQ